MGNALDLHPKPSHSFRERSAWGGVATLASLASFVAVAVGLGASPTAVVPHVVVDGHESHSLTTRFHLHVRIHAGGGGGADASRACTSAHLFAVDSLGRAVPLSGDVKGAVGTDPASGGFVCDVKGSVRSNYGRGVFRLSAPAALGPDHDIVALSVDLDDDGSEPPTQLSGVSRYVPSEALVFSTLPPATSPSSSTSSSSTSSSSSLAGPVADDAETRRRKALARSHGSWTYFVQLVPTDWAAKRASQIAATRYFSRWEESVAPRTFDLVFTWCSSRRGARRTGSPSSAARAPSSSRSCRRAASRWGSRERWRGGRS